MVVYEFSSLSIWCAQVMHKLSLYLVSCDSACQAWSWIWQFTLLCWLYQLFLFMLNTGFQHFYFLELVMLDILIYVN